LRTTLVALATWCLPTAVAAQPRIPPPQLDEPAGEVTVTAPTRSAARLLDATRSIASDTRNDAERSLTRDVGDRLDELPGVFVQRTTSASAAPFVRGLGGQRALLLYDGLRLNDSLTRVGGNALLSLIDPSAVRSVEVVRGAASVLYGSDALGGVVLVMPLDATVHPGGDAHLYGDVTVRGALAERSLQTRALIEGETTGFGLLASGSIGTTGRLMAGGDLGEQTYTGFEDRSANVRAVVAPTRTQRFGLAMQTAGVFDAPRPDLSSANDQRIFRVQQRDLAYGHWRGTFGRVVASARAGVMKRDEVRDRLRADRTDVETDNVITAHALAQVEVTSGGAHVTVGLDLARDAVSSRTETLRAERVTQSRGRYVDGSSYFSGGAYALWRQRVGERVLLEAGARLAVVSAQAPVDGTMGALDRVYLAPVGGIGLRVLVAQGVALIANAQAGFRAPNLDDYQALGSGARGFEVPNHELGPERSWNLELGARVVRGAWSGQVFAYGTLLDGLVARTPSSLNGMTMVDGRRVYTRINASNGVLMGTELDAGYRPSTGLQASLGLAYTWAEADTPTEDGVVREPLAKVPPLLVRASLGWRLSRGWAELVATAMAPQPRLSMSDRDDVRLCPNGPAMCTSVDGYATFAVRGGVQVHRNFVVAAAVENVFNAAFTPFGGGFPGAGINALLSLRVRSE
jgi:outer membrane receptor protein involved in Fe transport